LAKSSIQEITGIPVQYVWLIDFGGFKEVIDAIGGVDVMVNESFTDSQYPIAGKENDLCNGDIEYKCRYETIKFIKGITHMDGDTALKYSRSRHADSNQGTDFARGKRQQDIIIAIKEKIQKEKLWSHPSIAKKLFDLSQKITKTDMTWSEKVIFFRLFSSLNFSSIKHLTLDDGDPQNKIKGLLVNPPLWKYGGAWVLIPEGGTFENIHTYMKCNFYQIGCKE
jgi:LCP family protein required for cell wall assembly